MPFLYLYIEKRGQRINSGSIDLYGKKFKNRVKNMDFKEVATAPGSPWQNAYAERVIGSMRRECLDHVIVFNEIHLKRILSDYFSYYHKWRTHYCFRHG